MVGFGFHYCSERLSVLSQGARLQACAMIGFVQLYLPLYPPCRSVYDITTITTVQLLGFTLENKEYNHKYVDMTSG